MVPTVNIVLAGSYVVFVAHQSFNANLNISALSGSNGFVINGIDADDSLRLFRSSSAGDLNGDGFDDIVVGARRADPNGRHYGRLCLSGGFSASLSLNTLNGGKRKINGIDR